MSKANTKEWKPCPDHSSASLEANGAMAAADGRNIVLVIGGPQNQRPRGRSLAQGRRKSCTFQLEQTIGVSGCGDHRLFGARIVITIPSARVTLSRFLSRPC